MFFCFFLLALEESFRGGSKGKALIIVGRSPDLNLLKCTAALCEDDCLTMLQLLISFLVPDTLQFLACV